MTDKEKKVLRYVGNGRYLIGVPGRDLTQKEAGKHGGVEYLCNAPSPPVYELIEKKPAKNKKVKKKEDIS